MMTPLPIRFVSALAFAAFLGLCASARSEELLRDGTLDLFRPADGWRGVAEVAAVPGKCEILTRGEGRIIVSGQSKAERAPYLLTREEYGDVRVELEFMVPTGSNSGVYMMGRYEVQILDSFGRKRFGSGDLGAIYERHDPARPEGQQTYGGIAPKVNAAKPPGEWQTLEILFRAPRFDEAGKKISDARFEEVLVNGVRVQENASTTGPTRSAPLEGEAARGPVAIQGDHGPIAIRRFRVTSAEDAEQARLAALDAYWAEVSRAVKEGDFDAYQATCHDEGVLVSGSKKMSQPLSAALARWKQEFSDTRDGKIKAGVEFRFSSRVGDATTAHETGIFRYVSQAPGEPAKQEHIHFTGLLVKREGAWKILMENQKGLATAAEWQALE